jgi:hypothetical protein
MSATQKYLTDALDFLVKNLKSHVGDCHHKTDSEQLKRCEAILREAISELTERNERDARAGPSATVGDPCLMNRFIAVRPPRVKKWTNRHESSSGYDVLKFLPNIILSRIEGLQYSLGCILGPFPTSVHALLHRFRNIFNQIVDGVTHF